MDEKSLYAHILNLSAPWQVESLSLDEKTGGFVIERPVSLREGIDVLAELRRQESGFMTVVDNIDGFELKSD